MNEVAIQLVLTVCLVENPNLCKDLYIPTEAKNQMQCFRAAPIVIAQHLSTMPKWTIRRWKCATEGRAQDI